MKNLKNTIEKTIEYAIYDVAIKHKYTTNLEFGCGTIATITKEKMDNINHPNRFEEFYAIKFKNNETKLYTKIDDGKFLKVGDFIEFSCTKLFGENEKNWELEELFDVNNILKNKELETERYIKNN